MVSLPCEGPQDISSKASLSLFSAIDWIEMLPMASRMRLWLGADAPVPKSGRLMLVALGYTLEVQVRRAWALLPPESNKESSEVHIHLRTSSPVLS